MNDKENNIKIWSKDILHKDLVKKFVKKIPGLFKTHIRRHNCA